MKILYATALSLLLTFGISNLSLAQTPDNTPRTSISLEHGSHSLGG